MDWSVEQPMLNVRPAVSERLGFTLIELLIVVAIIGILAAIAVPNFLNAQTRAKVSRVKSDHRTIDVAMESYRLDNGSYPAERATSANGMAGYKYLTTPVAYLHAILSDPFGLKNVGSRGNDYDVQYEFHVTRRSGAKNNLFNLESVGPDGFDGFGPTSSYPSHPAIFDFYDSSNGVRSYGDIIRPGGDYIPRWFRERRGGPSTVGNDWI